MKLVSPGQMNEIDNLTIRKIGIPGIVLMENAALKVVEEISKGLGMLMGKKVVLFAGKGNNGGDAFAVARHLYNKGVRVVIYITAPKDEIRNDARVNLDIMENMGIKPVEIRKEEQIRQAAGELATADLIVDGIFGTGLKDGIKGLANDIIKEINNSGRPVISIDIPSGVCGESGKVTGACVRADKTVTFCLPKTGLVVHPGCEYTGELVIADIGIPISIVEGLDIKYNFTDSNTAASMIPKRLSQSNKGDYGKVLIVTGSVGMTGAGCLAGGSALRTGAGLVYLGVPASLVNIYDTLLAEAVTLPLTDKDTGYLSKECIVQVLDKLGRMDAAALGPGLSLNGDIAELAASVIGASKVPLVLDADALNAVSKDISVLKELKCEAVLTPHPGEMARLMGITIEDVQNNRIEAAAEFSKKWNVITVLKGSRTVVAAPDGRIYINPTGNSGMATAGTGDVLTGIITGLIGQGATPLAAAAAGVYLHGLAGDLAAKVKGEHGVIAGDLVSSLPDAMKQVLSAER